MLLWLLLAQEVEVRRLGPPDPSWTLRETRLRMPLGPDDRGPDRGDGMVELRRDGLVRVGPDERAPVVWTEKRWFDGRRDVRILLYDGANRLRWEFEDLGGTTTSRHLHADGSTSSYYRSKGPRIEEGFSLSPERRQVFNGSGELVIPELRAGDWSHGWAHRGDYYLWKEYRAGRCTRILLRVGNDSLDVTRGSENLYLGDESWSVADGGAPSFQLMRTFMTVDGQLHTKDVKPRPDVREMPYRFSQRRGDEDHELNEIVKEWAVAYPKRRAESLARFEERMKDAGQSWAGLGIEFVRDDAPWPGP